MTNCLVRTKTFAFVAAVALTITGCAGSSGGGDDSGGSAGGDAENAESIASVVTPVAEEHGDEVFMVELPSEASGMVSDVVVTVLESGALEYYGAPSGDHYGSKTAFPTGSVSAADFPYDALIDMRDQDMTCAEDGAAPTIRAWITAGGSTVVEADCATGGGEGELMAQEIDGEPVGDLTALGPSETLDTVFAEVQKVMGDQTPVSMLFSMLLNPEGTFQFEFAQRPGPDGSSCAPSLMRAATIDPVSTESGIAAPQCAGLTELTTPLDPSLFNGDTILSGMETAVDEFNKTTHEDIPPMSMSEISSIEFTSEGGALNLTIIGSQEGQISAAVVRP